VRLSLSGVAAGDQILVASTQTSGTSITAPAGYGLVGTYTSGSGSSAAKTIPWRKTATGGETSITIGYGFASSESAAAAVYRGVDPTNPIDAIGTGSTSSGTSLSVASVTTTLSGDRLVVLQGATGNLWGAPWTAPSGMTQQTQAVSNSFTAAAIADQTQASPGPTGSRTATFGTAAALVGEMVALKSPGPTYLLFHQD
jgi:hypothetical protein